MNYRTLLFPAIALAGLLTCNQAPATGGSALDPNCYELRDTLGGAEIIFDKHPPSSTLTYRVGGKTRTFSGADIIVEGNFLGELVTVTAKSSRVGRATAISLPDVLPCGEHRAQKDAPDLHGCRTTPGCRPPLHSPACRRPAKPGRPDARDLPQLSSLRSRDPRRPGQTACSAGQARRGPPPPWQGCPVSARKRL